jgi:hypothetical protein
MPGFSLVCALLGRNIEPSDRENGGQSIVILSYRFNPSQLRRMLPNHRGESEDEAEGQQKDQQKRQP